MTYASKDDMVRRFGQDELEQLTDPNALGVDDDVLGAALADADAVIDAHLVARYELPLATVSRLVTNIACDLARAALYQDRITELVRQRHDDAMALLLRISKGQVSLGPDLAGQATPATGGVRTGQAKSAFDWDRFGGVR